MTRRDDSLSIRQMLDHAREAIELTQDRSRSDLDDDRIYFLAMTRLMEILGEVAGRVSEATRRSHPAIPWTEIVGLRNRLIHGYDQVDCDILWQIIQGDLPGLVSALDSALELSEPE